MFKNSKNKFFLFLFFIFYFLFPVLNGANAQTELLSSLSAFEISVSNRRPFPNEEITAKIQNVNFDVWKSYVSWILDGKTILQGKAKNEVVFKAGKLGSANILAVSIQTPNGENLKESIILRPADIDILWQANTYAPYFYKGKPFASPQSRITAAAIPYFIYQGKKIAGENLLFKWYLNGDFKIKGWGKDSFVFKTGLFSEEEYEVRVEISSQSEILIQEQTLNITVQNPRIIFYEYSPFEGIKFQKAVSEFKTSAGDYVQFIAEPYFTPNDKIEGLSYEWKMNGQKIANSPPFNMLNFSSEPGASGTVNINLTASYEDLLEKMADSFRIEIQ